MGIFSRFKKNKKKLKYRLEIQQEDNFFTIKGEFHKENYFTNELWAFSRDGAHRIKMMEIKPARNFEFSISLDEMICKLKVDGKDAYDWYFKIVTPYDSLSEAKRNSDDIETFTENGIKYATYFIRLGRFQHTSISGIDFYRNEENDTIINYVTTKGNLSVLINSQPESPTRVQLEKVQSRGDQMTIKGKMFTRNSVIKLGQVLLRGRETGVELTSTDIEFHHLKEETDQKYGLNRYVFMATINMVEMAKGKMVEDDVYDLYFNLKLHDELEIKTIRVGRPTFKAKLFLKEFYAKLNNEAAIVNPYYTFKKENLSFEVYKYPIENFNYLRHAIRWAWILRLLHRNKDVWIVGERIYKAQDTGYAFFKYMRTQHPEKNVYYVIDKDSPEIHNVEPFGNILHYKSKQHILKTIVAKRVISSHHPDYLYPIRTWKFKQRVKATKVFLQHGVMGTKNMLANYGKNAQGFDTDLFMVSSEFEKEMIVNDFGYHKDEVFVTGLSRFDTLFANDIPVKRQILIIPTWRDWLITDDLFLESEYYERYKKLINSDKLQTLASRYDFEVLFCLHPNMQKYSSHFKNDAVKVINQGEIDVQILIKQSALMVTDYSSVGFDFSFLYKPVIYYQFDRSRFIGARPSHLDLDNDLPGEVGFQLEDILQLIRYYAEKDFLMKDEYKERANKFIKYRDQRSSERIYHVVKENNVKHYFNQPKVNLIIQGLYKKFRRSEYYFPIMKAFYKVGQKVIPVDNKLILFESGLGKQFGDSPRNIYEEILRQDLDYKKVWVYNKPHRFSDKKTKRIKRLSPQYYYYLIKARYWVNNQNFPTYIKKRKATTYLQTWHGTPLKKMLYDIEEVHGRSDDYVERVGEAVKNWDYLISPSQYATDAFRSAFRYDKEVLQVGYPRNDIFYNYNEDIINRILRRLHIPADKKVILYAPTFRDNQTNSKNKFLFELKMDLNEMKAQLGDEYIILLRMHVVISNNLSIADDLQDFAIDVSNYPDIQELLLVTDILITDYSSVMFDFANTLKPILFFTYDFDEYRDKLRGFYMDFKEEAPGPMLEDTEGIIESIKNIEQLERQYKHKYQQFHEKYCSLDDGRASERIVNKIFK